MPLDEAEAELDRRADARPGERTREAPSRDRVQEVPPREPSGDQDHGDGKGGGEPPHRRPRWVLPFIIILVLIAVIGGVTWWYLTRNQQSTDDAYTDGRAITMAAKVSGYVVELNVNDNQFVHKGDVLVRIDPRDYVASRDQARGQLEAAQGQVEAARAGFAVAKVNFPSRLAAAQAQRDSAAAALTRAEADLRRQNDVAKAATSQQNIDQARATELQARASLAEAEANLKQAQPVPENIAQSGAQVHQLEGQITQAQAQLAQAELNLSYTVIRAPQDGWVTRRNVEMGNYLQPGASIMSLVTPDVWVTANFKENQLDRMRPGQKVAIAVDAYPGLKLTGHVDSVQLGSGSRFSAFPAENATGNYVKIVQRIPVKIDIDSGLDPNLPLPLGLSVIPTVTLQ